MRARKFTMVAAVVVTTIGALAGCSGSDDRVGQKSGGDPAARTLRLGTVEESSAPYAAEVLHFADTVESKSKGSLHVEVEWAAAGDYTAQTEQEVATMVQDGRLDAAIVPTRVWDKLGVTSMQALQAPFLVDSLQLLDAVATEPVAGEMLAGLPPVGIEGLALWPESLRHPVGMSRLLVKREDFAGARLRVPISDVSEQLVRAIGAEPVDPEDWSSALASGELDGFESGFLWSSQLPAYGTFTANITFYPKANSVAMNAKVLDGLSEEQQGILSDAAVETIAFIEGAHDSERKLALAYCAAGGGVALASDDDVAALTTLAAPVLARLEQDAVTKKLVEEIGAIKQGIPVDPSSGPAECELNKQQPSTTDETAAPATDSSTTQPVEFPEGLYRADSPIDGVITMTFVDGVWSLILEPNGPVVCSATYTIESGRIFMTTPDDDALDCDEPHGKVFLDATWTLVGDQLRFADINSNPNAIRDFGLGWTRIESGIDTAPSTGATAATEFPTGTYRTEVAADLIVTFEFADGGVWQSFLNGTIDCAGTWAVESGRIVLWHSSDLSLACGDAPGTRFLDADWTLEGDQFRLLDINSDPNAVRDFGVQWTKIE